MENLKLPRELEKLRGNIEATLRPTIKIATNEEKTTFHQSKFSGFPYLPKTEQLPRDANGEQMKLLAQINFEELPNGLENFPKQGILQFFLAVDDDLMGLDLDHQTMQTNFKVKYYNDILPVDQLVTDFSPDKDTENEYFPVTKELSLKYRLEQEAVSVADVAFENEEFFKDVDFEEVIKNEGNEEITLWDIYADTLTNEGHKMGGYGFFTQTDPREYEPYDNHTILLLQIDTDDEAGIMWGDAGVGNFFIKKEDLKKCDFTNVLYNWDCH